jgi:DNA replication licensing factor MCM7
MELAKHITNVHQTKEISKKKSSEIFTSNQLRTIVSYSKRFDPIIPKELIDFISDSYVEMRTQDEEEKNEKNKQHTTPRTLLSILRLSQAIARIRFSNVVKESDVEEAIRLMDVSKISLIEDNKKKDDVLSEIYEIFKNYYQKNKNKNDQVKIDDIKTTVFSKGFFLI